MQPPRLILALFLAAMTGLAAAAEPSAGASPSPSPSPDAANKAPTPLNKEGTVLLDLAHQRLILKAQVCLRAGPLEMFLCKAQTKEHEAILSVKSDAYVIHAGLLALGAQVGAPVRYEPKFQPPTGQKIKVVLRWKDEQGEEHTAPAQKWVRHTIYRYYSSPLEKLPEGFALPKESELRYDDQNHELLWFGPMTPAQKDDLLSLSDDPQYSKGIMKFFEQSQSREMEADWVFAGSGFLQNGDGTKYYQAEDGNVICVANFGDALLDITIPSTASNDNLEFEPWTDRIPPLGTEVEVSLIPVPAEGAKQPAVDPPTGPPKPSPPAGQ